MIFWERGSNHVVLPGLDLTYKRRTKKEVWKISYKGNMVGVEEAMTFRSHLNGDLDPDDREEGISSRAEEAAKKKRQRRGRAKRLCQQCNKNLDKESAKQLERPAREGKERDDDDDDDDDEDGDGDVDGTTGKKKKKEEEEERTKSSNRPSLSSNT